MESAIECVICYNDYDDKTRKPCIGTCGHQICEYCKNMMTTSKCPHCNREEAFVLTTINWGVLDMIKAFKVAQNKPEVVEKIISKPKSFNEGGECSECESKARKLRICIDCGEEEGVLRRDGETPKSFSLNLTNSSVDEAILKARKIAICGDCALDGYHSKHQVGLFAELEKNVGCVQERTVTEKIIKSQKQGRELVEKCQKTVNELEKISNEYLELGGTLAVSEKKTHYNNVDFLNEKVKQSQAMLADVVKRMEMLNDEAEMEIRYVKQNKKSYSKKDLVFANDQPTLIADRKQSVKDPLLIGMFDPKNKVWQSIGRMPTPKSNYAVATNKNKIFIVGGMNGGLWLNSLEMYDRDRNLRKDGPTLKHGRTRTSAGFHNHKLYVAGGYDGTYMSSVEVYNPDTNEWRDAPNLTRPRADCSLVSCNGELYILGGYNGKDYEEKIEKLNEETHQFEVVGDMEGSRAGFGACVFKGRIYIAGGWSSSNNTLKTVKSYDPMVQKWRDELSLSRDRKYFTLHATHEAVYAIRGCADSWTQIAEVERLDTEKGQWEVFSCVAQISGNSSSSPNRRNTGNSQVAVNQGAGK